MPNRKYKIKFRINISDETFNKDRNFQKYYLPKWSRFMREVNSRKLMCLPSDKTASVKDLPMLRELLKSKIKTLDVIELLNDKDPELSRILLEVSPLFDSSPIDLKAHILATFGITAEKLRNFLENK